MQGCPHSATETRQGVKLCRLHAARGEKASKAEPGAESRRGTKESSSLDYKDSVKPDSNPWERELPQLMADILQRILSQERPTEAYHRATAEYPELLGSMKQEDLLNCVRREANQYLGKVDIRADSEVVRALQQLSDLTLEESPRASQDPVLKLLKAPAGEFNQRQEESPIGVSSSAFQAPRSVSLPEPSTPNPVSTTNRFPSAGPVSLMPQEDKQAFVSSLLRRRREGTANPIIPPSTGHSGPLEAFRPFHTGAYTDVSGPYSDEATKALQASAKAVGSKDEASAQDKGKLASIGRTEERIMFLLRGCDTLTVGLGEATVGKELFHSLRNMATQSRPLLRALKFPVNITNRFAFGVSSITIGGRGQLADFALTSGDFPQTSEEDFDMYSPPADTKLERKPRPPTSLSFWYRCALRQCWALACVFGTEHYGSWEAAAGHLLKLGEEHAHAWPLQSILATWDELWGRFCEEARDLERKLRREMSEEAPSFERIRFFSTAPGPDGTPWLRLPSTFDLEDPQEYFQTDVLPRHKRMLDRACWNLALKRAPLQGGKAGADTREGPRPRFDSDPGARTGQAGAPPPLLGSKACFFHF